MARAYPLPFKPPNDEALSTIFGPGLTATQGGRQTRAAISKELLGLAPTSGQFLYHINYARIALAAAPSLKDFLGRTAWQAETLHFLAKWAKSAEARATSAYAITSYYSKIGQFAVKLDGFGDRLYIPNPASSNEERPIDYVGISPSTTAWYLHHDRVQLGRRSYVPLLPDVNHRQGILSLGHWNIPGIQTPETQAAITDAFEQTGPITSDTGLEVLPWSLFCAGKIVVDQVAFAPTSLFMDATTT